MSHGKQWSLETTEFIYVLIYMSILLHMFVSFQSVWINAGFQFLFSFMTFRVCVWDGVAVNFFYSSFSESPCSYQTTTPSVGNKQISLSVVWMRKTWAARSPVSFSLPAILFVQPLRPPVNAAAGLASFLALLLLISARHRDRQKERAFSGRS